MTLSALQTKETLILYYNQFESTYNSVHNKHNDQLFVVVNFGSISMLGAEIDLFLNLCDSPHVLKSCARNTFSSKPLIRLMATFVNVDPLNNAWMI